jgi:hypothetical protein
MAILSLESTDFIMMKSVDSRDKIAIDIKTTYIRSDGSSVKFTLGSFGSYIRNNTKNIAYRYTDYAKHYVIDEEYNAFLETIRTLLADKEAFEAKYKVLTNP